MEFSNLRLYVLVVISTISLLLVTAKNETSINLDPKNRIALNVGLIFDFNSSTGLVANSCIAMALSDFYSTNPHYTTRLALHPKNANDVLSAASAALELVNEDQVDAIIGPQNSKQAIFVAEIGGRSHVPVISFSVTSSSLLPSLNPYFIRTTLPDSSQLEAITSLVRHLGWHAVVVIYQDETDGESSTGFIPSLTHAFQKASIQLSYLIAISSSAGESQIKQELSHLKTMQTRVFLVHVTSSDLASRLFSLANEVGIMNKGTAWIITDALSNTLSSLDAATIEAMEGVLGVRPYVPKSKNLENFKIRRKENKINIFCLRAYDTVWALATSVEKLKFPQVKRSRGEESNASSAAITNLRVSETGPRLVKNILETRFLGLSGEFKLEDGQLETPVLELINVVGNGDRIVGYWTPRSGFSRKILSATEEGLGNDVLKPIIWPGDSTTKPNGWDVPGMGLKLRVGVPKKTGFREFVNVAEVGDSKKYNVTGFCIDVFQAALDSLPFKLEPEYIPLEHDSNGTYKDLVDKLKSDTKTPLYDALAGDITIRADREGVVDFSLPYLESGVVMVVRAEPDRLKNIWIFLKPLSWDLWLTIVVAAIFIGLVLRMLERRVNPQRQLGILFLFPLAALAFPERNMVGNKWAKFVLVVWLFMAYILMQSYTANLSSILTVSQLRPSADNPVCAGYQKYSFVGDMLKKMNIKRVSYTSMEDYDRALSLGCKNGGVDAIFDEIPYIKLFLHKYGSKYQTISSKILMDGAATSSTGGFGFAFPSGSPLSKPISKAILDVMEEGKIQQIEKRYFGEIYTFQYHAEEISRDGPSLTAYSFAGLFTITAVLTLLALVCSECSFAIARYRNLNVNISRVQSFEMTDDVPSDESDQRDSKEEAEIIDQEENEQDVQPTNIQSWW